MQTKEDGLLEQQTPAALPIAAELPTPPEPELAASFPAEFNAARRGDFLRFASSLGFVLEHSVVGEDETVTYVFKALDGTTLTCEVKKGANYKSPAERPNYIGHMTTELTRAHGQGQYR